MMLLSFTIYSMFFVNYGNFATITKPPSTGRESIPYPCPANQLFSTCASPCGPRSCKPSGISCITLCVNGCVCPQDLLVNSQGVCVPIEQCDCGENQVMACEKCGPKKCPGLDTPCEADENTECIWQCICQDGFYQNADEKCVKISECPRKCPPSKKIQ